MAHLFYSGIYQPLLNLLIFFYTTLAFHDLGIAIILLTILIRLILFPLFQKSVEHQMIMQELQPKLKKVQENHAGNREAQSRAMMDLYKEHKINPFSGFLFLLIQLPILIALYQILLGSLKPTLANDLYSFVANPGPLNVWFLGLINLSTGSTILVALAAIAQYFQGKMALPVKKSGEEATAADRMARNMVFVAPLLTLLIFSRLPSAISLYWFTTSLFSIGQQYIVNKKRTNGKLGIIYKETR